MSTNPLRQVRRQYLVSLQACVRDPDKAELEDEKSEA